MGDFAQAIDEGLAESISNERRWAAGRARHASNLETQRAEFKRLRHLRGLFNNPKLHDKGVSRGKSA